MNNFENSLKTRLAATQQPAPPEVRERVLDSIAENVAAPKFRRTASVARVAIVAAVATALLLTTALAYGDEIASFIKQIFFGDSSATQVEELILDVMGDDGEITQEKWDSVMWFEPNENDTKRMMMDINQVYVDSIEEAQDLITFDIKVPEYLASLELLKVRLFQYEDGTYQDQCMLHFTDEEMSSNYVLTIYIRVSDTVNLTTIDDVEKVTIGDVEGALVTRTMLGYESYDIYWVLDGMLYQLTYGNQELDLDTLLEIAESVK